MPKPSSKSTSAPPTKRPRRLWLNIGSAVLALGALVAVVVINGTPATNSEVRATPPPPVRPIHATPAADFARFAQLSARDLVAMSDAELEAMDPLVMNMVVAKGLPELAGIDFAKYAKVVDGWADRIGRGLAASETHEMQTSTSYKADPDIWRAGGMAIALAGPAIGIAYTRDVKLTNHADLFVPGLIDTKRGTCSNMPVLYMAVAHRLGWPLKAVVAGDHMWCRWDDGKKRFNLEATSTTAGSGEGSFSTPPDKAYRTDLNIPAKAVEVGSDLATLTARQTLGVYLQQRSGYFRETGKWAEAEEDILLARVCFPENRDIFRNLLMVMDERGKRLYTLEEAARLFGRGEDPVQAQARRRAEQERLRQQVLDANRINQENRERRERERQSPDR